MITSLIHDGVQVFMRFNIAHLFSCFINLPLELERRSIFSLRFSTCWWMSSRLLISSSTSSSWGGGSDGLLLMVPCFSHESFVPLFGIDQCKDGAVAIAFFDDMVYVDVVVKSLEVAPMLVTCFRLLHGNKNKATQN
jgi:hypothetical protein